MISDNLKRQDIWWRMVNAYVPNLRPTGDGNYIGTCPHPDHDDKVPSFSVHELDMVFNCFGGSCGWQGNAVDFAKQFGNDPKPFYVLTAKGYHIPKKGFAPSNKPVNSQNIAGNSKKISARASTNIAPQKKVAKNSHYCRKNEAVKKWKLIPLPKEKCLKGWDMELIEPLQIHWSKSGECFAFPNIDADGKWQGCSLHKPKSGNSQSIGNCSVYPLGVVKNYDPDDVTFLVEGQKDCARIVSLELQGISYTHGALSTPKDLTPLSHLKLITIIYDNDKGGRDGTKKQAEALKEKLPTAVISTTDWKELPESFTDGADISDVSDETIIALIGTEKTYNIEKIGDFEVLTSLDAKNTEPEPMEFIVDTLFPCEANTILAGETGSGKSYFAMAMGMGIANNEDEYLGFKINKKNLMVLYVDTELGVKRIHRRHNALLGNFSSFNHNKFVMLTAKGRQDDIYESIERGVQLYQPDAVFIDCLYTTAKGVRVDNYQVQVLTDAITTIQDEKRIWAPNGISTYTVHHFNKGNAQAGVILDRMKGASELQFWSDHITSLVRTNDDHLRLFRVNKTRDDFIPMHYFQLSWDVDNQKFINDGVITKWRHLLEDEAKMNDWVQFLDALEEIADSKKQFQRKDALNIGENQPFNRGTSTIDRWLKDLARDGFLRDEGYGLWALTEMKVVDEIE